MSSIRADFQSYLDHFLLTINEEERDFVLGHLITTQIVQRDRHIPRAAWHPLHQAVYMAYLDVAIIRQEGVHLNILLTRRPKDDPEFPGEPWHIPGGLWRPPDTLDEGCRKIIQEECGITVLSRITRVDFEDWHDHRRGYPISHVVACESPESVEQTERRKFFCVHNLPSMVPHHADFVRRIHGFVQLGLSERLR